MQFPMAVLRGIRAGELDLAFRRWRRPVVRVGTEQRTAVGVIAVDEVSRIEPGELTGHDARRAGFPDVDALLATLRPGHDRDLYRVLVRFAGADHRIELRAAAELSDAELAELDATLDGMDARSRRGAWTRAVLAAIAARPGVVARELAADLGRETAMFKADVRRLKELGFTESLEVGYRLSPRGQALLARPERAG